MSAADATSPSKHHSDVVPTVEAVPMGEGICFGRAKRMGLRPPLRRAIRRTSRKTLVGRPAFCLGCVLVDMVCLRVLQHHVRGIHHTPSSSFLLLSFVGATLYFFYIYLYNGEIIGNFEIPLFQDFENGGFVYGIWCNSIYF